MQSRPLDLQLGMVSPGEPDNREYGYFVMSNALTVALCRWY